MWDPENKLIRFVAEQDFSDPSYHLPHFYQLFALWADEEDRPFWAVSYTHLPRRQRPIRAASKGAGLDTPHQEQPPQQQGGQRGGAGGDGIVVGVGHLAGGFQ